MLILAKSIAVVARDIVGTAAWDTVAAADTS